MAATTLTLLLAAVVGLPAADDEEWLEVVVRTVDASVITAHDRTSGVLITTTSGGPRGAAQARHVLSKTKVKEGAYQWEVLELRAASDGLDKFESDLPEPALPGSWVRAFLDSARPPATCAREIHYNVVGPGGADFTLRAVPCSVEQASRIATYFDALRASRHFLRISPDSHGASRFLRASEWEALAKGTLATTVATTLGPPDQVWPSWPDGFAWFYPAHESAAVAAVVVTFDRSRAVQSVRPLTGVRFAK